MTMTPDKPVVAIYIRYYLTPSETFVYRQLKGVSSAFDPVVLTSHVANRDVYPFESIHVQGKSFSDKVVTRLQRMLSGRYTSITKAQQRHWTDAAKRSGAKMIHAHFGHFGLDILPVARALNLPLLVTFHGQDASRLLRDKRYTNDLAALFKYARVITVSHNMAERLASHGADISRIDVHYIGVPVGDFEFTTRVPLREKIGRGEPLRFLQVSNFVEKKGHRCTVEAFARYLAGSAQSTLTFAGDGPLRGDIEALCYEKGIADRVRFVGKVVKEQVSELMREADVFLHHSVTARDGDIDGIPTVIMEAMSTGLVVVSTVHSGIPELIEDGVDGYLVGERDVDAYAARLARLSDTSPDMGEKARRKIEDKFNIATQNERLTAIYKRVIDDHRI
jgi:glycosyltransferase involved in cell wall biosynthesis